MKSLNTRLLTTGLALLAGGLSGCESTDSEDVKTSGMYATFTATSDGTGTRAEAVLKVGGALSNNFVKLSSGDALSVQAGTENLPLTETHFGDLYSYVGDLTTDAPGTEVNFKFDRSDATDSAPASKTTIPPVFSVSAPAAATVLQRDMPITITWAPSGTSDQMAVQVTGGCIVDFKRAVDGDPGSYTINAGTITTPQNKEMESCAGTIIVTRARTGTLDPKFGEGGSVTAIQSRSVEIRLDP